MYIYLHGSIIIIFDMYKYHDVDLERLPEPFNRGVAARVVTITFGRSRLILLYWIFAKAMRARLSATPQKNTALEALGVKN
jgi:hypothetical protein